MCESVSLMSTGRALQARSPSTEKVLSEMQSASRHTTNLPHAADRSRVSSQWSHSSARYSGAIPCWKSNIKLQSLNCIRLNTSNQWSRIRKGDTWHRGDASQRSLATASCTRWGRRSVDNLTLQDHASHGEAVYSPVSVLIVPPHEGMARLSWPGWLVTYHDDLTAPRWSPIPEIIGVSIPQLKLWTMLIET